MLKFREYVRAESLEDAYVRNQKKSAHILGGMLWLKMQNRTVQTVIDLSDLGLSGIEETEEEYRIGAMTSLRELELHKGLDAHDRRGRPGRACVTSWASSSGTWPPWAAVFLDGLDFLTC